MERIINEILNFLRNSEIISDAVRKVDNETITVKGNNSKTITFQAEGLTNIKSVKIGTEENKKFTIENLVSPFTIELEENPGTKDVEIKYQKAKAEKYMLFFPHEKIEDGDFPRIAFEITEQNTKERTINAQKYWQEYTITFAIFSKQRGVIVDLTHSLFNILVNKKFDSLVHFEHVETGPILYDEGYENIFEQFLSFKGPANAFKTNRK